MPITEFLDGYNPDPETKRVMGIAFERLASPFDLQAEVTSPMK